MRDEQENQKSRAGITIPKWLASIVIAAVLGWGGSWIGYTAHSGATVETRVTVLENRVERADEDRKEILERVKNIENLVQWLTNQVVYSSGAVSPPSRRTADRLNAPPVPPTRASRDPREVQCNPDETKVLAANGEWFCQKR